MDTVRFGIIGLGNIGGLHAEYLPTLSHAAVTAMCNRGLARRQTWAQRLKGPVFANHHELLESGLVDAVLIATPHVDHVPIALAAFARNVHVLCEKPLAPGIKAARGLVESYHEKYTHLKFGIMFQMRTNPLLREVRKLIRDGELGEIYRFTWIATNWFRTWAYYASGGWRATWAGEGGGVLINQCPHNLDMIWYLLGMMPTRVTAVAAIGKRHPIEVEDEVSAILEYPNGAVGHFITSTGEAPGTNRLEIVGDRGRLLVEDGKIRLTRSRVGVAEFGRTATEAFGMPEMSEVEISASGAPESHQAVTQQFVDVVRNDLTNAQLIAPGPEGLHSLELGNAMLLAGMTRQCITLPLDGEAYDTLLCNLAKKYGGQKTLETKEAVTDVRASFAR